MLVIMLLFILTCMKSTDPLYVLDQILFTSATREQFLPSILPMASFERSVIGT